MRIATLLLIVCGGRAYTFGQKTSVLGTLTPSRKCYFKTSIATGTAYTVPAGAEITFDNVTWLSIDGTWPEGATWWMCRATSSASYSTAVTVTPTIDGVDYPFTVTTVAAPESTSTIADRYTNTDHYTGTENYI